MKLDHEQIKNRIEQFLLDRRGWVSSAEICAVFGVRERELRQIHDCTGLCSSFAISGQKGFKHVSLASTTEWEEFSHRIRRHGIQELVRVRDLGRLRESMTRPTKTMVFEKDSGQALLQGVI